MVCNGQTKMVSQSGGVHGERKDLNWTKIFVLFRSSPWNKFTTTWRVVVKKI